MSKKENKKEEKIEENKKVRFIANLWRFGGLGLAVIGIIGLGLCSITE